MMQDSLLGKPTEYIQTYTPELLYPIPRSLARDKTNVPYELPFSGIDMWTGYELSWLNSKGKPEIAIIELLIPCTSPNIVEHKSVKLYFNSFNQTTFHSHEEIKSTIETDLQRVIQAPISVHLYRLSPVKSIATEEFSGVCLDLLDIGINTYEVNPEFLKVSHVQAQESLFSNLLKSNCLATGQPDWGSVLIHYEGPKIDHEGLLKYIISFRNHAGFAEHCIEEIYCDILRHCRPTKLTVYGRYTRRGGLDINPFRSNFEQPPKNRRHIRQ